MIGTCIKKLINKIEEQFFLRGIITNRQIFVGKLFTITVLFHQMIFNLHCMDICRFDQLLNRKDRFAEHKSREMREREREIKKEKIKVCETINIVSLVGYPRTVRTISTVYMEI